MPHIDDCVLVGLDFWEADRLAEEFQAQPYTFFTIENAMKTIRFIKKCPHCRDRFRQIGQRAEVEVPSLEPIMV